jgi:hypothetical protein
MGILDTLEIGFFETCGYQEQARSGNSKGTARMRQRGLQRATNDSGEESE